MLSSVGVAIHAAEALSLVKSEEKEYSQLAREALGGGDFFFDPSGQRHGTRLRAPWWTKRALVMARVVCPALFHFAQGRKRVRGFSGLGDDDDCGAAQGYVAAAATVFTGVLDVDRETAEILEKNLGGEPTVSA